MKTGAGAWIAAAVVLAIIWFIKVQRAVIAYEVAAGVPTGSCAIDRLKVPLIKRVDDSDAGREKTLIAPVGPLRHAEPPGPRLSPSFCWSSSRPARRRRSSASARPTRGRRRRSRPPAARTTSSPRASERGSTPRFRSWSTSTTTPEAPQRIFEGAQKLPDVDSVGEPRLNDGGDGLRSCSSRRASAPQDEATDKLIDHLRFRRRPGRHRGRRRARLRVGPERGVQGHRRPDHQSDAAVPALHHRRHVHRARDGVAARSSSPPPPRSRRSSRPSSASAS